jgi:hypothetical protein
LWISWLKEVSGLRSAYAIEMALDGERVKRRSTDVNRPRKWDGYVKGTTVPSTVPGPRNAIAQAEARFPGAARYFFSPLWSYLKNELSGSAQFEQALQTLEPDVVSLLFEDEPPSPRIPVRPKPFDEDRARQLCALGSFDAMVAALLLAGLAEFIASQELRQRALNTYLDLQVRVRQIPLLEALAPELFAVIDQHSKHWAYPSPNERVEIAIFSEEMPTGKDLEDFLRAAMASSDEEAQAPAHPIAISDGSGQVD